MAKSAITPTREQDYPDWYQQVIQAAELAENAPVRGCMVIKPWGYHIWENIQRDLDDRFKATGHVNAYFPLLIPLSHLEKEAEHVEGFAKECAVVTHHRLTQKPGGGLIPDGELEEPLVIRPTSETMIGEMYSRWVQSYRDLPILINQWANVMRWEMRTRLFLRTSEFLWQEGHTAHANAEEAIAETLKMLDVYRDFAKEMLAMPVIQGEKTINERFPGAVNTYCIEAMMQDRKALQAGTSHFLGQNFAKASNIQFQTQAGALSHAWTTSWGVSTRLIGALIMTHSDDNGLVLPPRIAPQHIVLLPIYKTEGEREAVLNYCDKLQSALTQKCLGHVRILTTRDDRDMRGGDKLWHWVKKGIPFIVEIGPRDLEKDQIMLIERDTENFKDKQVLSFNEFVDTVETRLQAMQERLLEKARLHQANHTHVITNLADFTDFFTPSNAHKPEIHGGFATCFAHDSKALDDYLKPLKVTARCIPLDQTKETGNCIFTGEKVSQKIIFAKAY